MNGELKEKFTLTPMAKQVKTKLVLTFQKEDKKKKKY